MMKWKIFSPEIYYLLVGLWFLALSMLPRPKARRDYFSALFLAAAGILVCLISVKSEGVLFFNAYQVICLHAGDDDAGQQRASAGHLCFP